MSNLIEIAKFVIVIKIKPHLIIFKSVYRKAVSIKIVKNKQEDQLLLITYIIKFHNIRNSRNFIF